MNRATPIILGVVLIILMGCGDEEEGFPNPLQVEVLTEEEEESSLVGSITGRVLFTDSDGQVRAYPLSSNEYVIFQGSSGRVSGKNLDLFLDFPSNNTTHLMEGGYFQIMDVEPGTHELALVHTEDVVIVADPDILPGDNYTEIDVPASQWIVTVEPDRNTTTGSLIVTIPDLEWESGEAGQEVVVPEKPEEPTKPELPPVVPTKPSGKPLVRPEGIVDGHVWLFDDVSGNEAPDDSANDLSGIIVGGPQVVAGLSGRALKFNGVDDGVTIPDSDFINVTNGPWPNRTVMAVFNCADVSKSEKQTVFEEGGRTRGLCIYVHEDLAWVGGWNRTADQSMWDPGEWISAPIESNRWYAAALVLRNATDNVGDGDFEMWLNGSLIDKRPAGQIYNHANDNAIGYTIENNVFHDNDGEGAGWYFEGMIDEVWVLNQALTQADLRRSRWSVAPADKLAAAWGAVKTQR